MKATASPSPFEANAGFTITALGGTAPYEFAAEASPPNPPGVVVDGSSNPATVMVPADTPSGTIIYVDVQDSGTPAQTVTVTNRVA